MKIPAAKMVEIRQGAREASSAVWDASIAAGSDRMTAFNTARAAREASEAKYYELIAAVSEQLVLARHARRVRQQPGEGVLAMSLKKFKRKLKNIVTPFVSVN